VRACRNCELAVWSRLAGHRLFCRSARTLMSFNKTTVACSFCAEVKLLLSNLSCHACHASNANALDGCDFVGIFILDTIAWKRVAYQYHMLAVLGHRKRSDIAML